MANVTDRLDIQVEENEDLSGIVLNATLLDGQAYLQEAVGGIGTQGEDEDEGGDMDVSRRRRGSMLARSAARIMNLTSPEYDSRDPQDSSRPNFPPRRPTIGFGAAEDEDTLRSAFFQLLFIYTNEAIDSGDKDHRFRAAEVLWHFCVHTYDVGVEDGVTRTSVAAAHVEIVDVENESNDVTNYFTLADAEGRDRFNVTQAWAYERLDGDLRRAFAGAYSTNYGPDDDYSEFNAEFGNNMGKGVDPSAMGPQEIDAKVWANLQAMTGNVAQSMTAQ
jgi:hypothetical protein